MAQVLLNWVIVGWTYALVSIWFNLIYSSVRFYHVAYWAVALLWWYLSLIISTKLWLNFFVSVLISSFITWFFWVAIWKFLYFPLKKKNISDVSMLIASFWLMIALQNLIALMFWNWTRPVSISDTIKQAYDVFSLSITFNQSVIMVVTIIAIAVFEFILNKTRLWKSIKAVGQNKPLAQIVWIDANKVILYTFFIGSFISSIWMSLISLEIWLRPMLSLGVILKVIISCIIWWIWNIRWALVWWMILWVSENIGIYFFWWNWQDVVAFSVLTVFLIFKPKWLFYHRIK